MKRLVSPWMAVGLVLFAYSSLSQAQMSNWGSGMNMAQPGCSVTPQMGEEAQSINDELKGYEADLKAARSDLRSAKSRRDSAKASLKAQRDLFKMTGFDGVAFNDIEDHITTGASCFSYRGACEFIQTVPVSEHKEIKDYPHWYFALMMNERMKGNEEAVIGDFFTETPATEVAQTERTSESISRQPAADLPRANPRPPQQPQSRGPVQACQEGTRTLRTGSFSQAAWLGSCGPGPGQIRPSICSQTSVDSIPRGRNQEACARYLEAWIEKQAEVNAMNAEEARLKAIVAELELLAKLKKTELREARREWEREQREASTEGGCVGCAVAARSGPTMTTPGLINMIGNFALGAYATYAGMQTSKYISDNNTRLGAVSTPMPMAGAAMTYGFPFFTAGLQGGLGGGLGVGAFGCSGSAFGGGSFGPMGAGGSFGGMSPFGAYGAMPGMNTMFGMPAGMYGTPMGSGMFLPGAGFNSQSFCPVWPCPAMGMGMNGGMGMPGMGMMGGIGMGMPGMGMNGMGMMGMPGMGMNGMGMMGMPGMGMNGMGMGMPGMGMMPGSFNPMMPGYLTPGMSAGFNTGGFGPFGGMNMNGMGMMNSFGMQQQRAQMNFMAGQQALQGLYMEMNNLQARIQITQAQINSGGMLGFDSSFVPMNSGFSTQFGGMIPGQIATTPQPYPFQQPYNTTFPFQQPGGTISVPR